MFGTPSNGIYPSTPTLAWNVTDNGGLTQTLGTTISFIGLQVVPVNGWIGATKSLACAAHLNGTSSVYYIIKHLASTVPNSNELFVDNKVYTNSSLTTTLGSTYLVISNTSGSGIPYVINGSGVVTSVQSVCNI